MAMKDLIKKRGSYKGQLTLFNNYVNSLSTTPTLTPEQTTELALRISKIELLFSLYDEIQMEIECLSEEKDSAAQLGERADFQAQYFSIISKAQIIYGQACPRKSRSVSGSEAASGSRRIDSVVNNNPGKMNVKLPTIRIPKFNGTYDMWLEFHDTFSSLIHSSENINNISKFHYLRASLEGSAALVINSLEFSSANYIVAWELLCDRYNNKRLLIHNHVSALFNLDQIPKESSSVIRKLIDQVSKNLRALKTLKEPTKHWDTLLIYMVANKLDVKTTREWEEHKPSHKVLTFDTLMTFLRNRADLLETLEVSCHSGKSSKIKGLVSVEAPSTSKSTSSPTWVTSVCPKCKGDHALFNCSMFLKLTNKERADEVSGYKVCYNCLRQGHYSKQCKRSSCKVCKRKHNSLLHVDREREQANEENTITSVALSARITPGHALLSTALVKIRNRNNKIITARAVLDSGSMSCFITKYLCKQLGLPTAPVDNELSGINNTIAGTIDEKCTLKLSSIHDTFHFEVAFFVIENITQDIPSTPLSTTELNIPNNVLLADPTFDVPGPVDVLLGSNIFWDLLGSGRISLGRNKPSMRETKLGWLVTGINPELHGKITCNLAIEHAIQKQLTKFWELEEVSTATTYSQEEASCEEHFMKNTTRLETGRFSVRIPLKQSEQGLGHSFERAKQCFLSLERRLQRQPALKVNYVNFMTEYKALGHMSEKKKETNEKVYYMPHHGVLRENSLTTKLRVVFNASCPTSSGLSSNDIQMVGPTIQDDLSSIILRFRTHKIVLSADIEKMYRQIVVNEKDRHLQTILWRENPYEELKSYEMNTVTYGTASAPFLAVRSLKQLALECEDPNISKIVMHDFYVDDLLSGADNVETAIHIRTAVTNLLASAGMHLRKWRSNEREVSKDPKSVQPPESLNLGDDDQSKTLGLGWNSQADELFFAINISESDNVSKRSILSAIAQIFDPLGLLSPCVIESKILLQKLWLHKLSWDEPVPSEISESWAKFIKHLPDLNNLRIPRCVMLCDLSIRIELHVFTDASQNAYGACMYVRTKNNKGVVLTRLLFSKSRVAPIKPTTIPRLELCGAYVGAKLYDKVLNSLRLRVDCCTFWTDSTIVLGWLHMLPSKLKPFVRNRVSDILETTGNCLWRHVPTKDNPADYVSRGADACSIGSNDVWWSGPKYLQNDESCWPPNLGLTGTDSLPELRPEAALISTAKISDKCDFIEYTRFSKLNKLKRSAAYMMRFVYNCRNPRNKKSGHITVEEIQAAFIVMLKWSQIQCFSEEYKCLTQSKPLPSKNRILKLNPFVHDDGLLRVGGRLANSDYEYNKKHPILIQSTHYISKLICIDEHLRLMHAGPQLLLASVRQEFWPIGGRNLARSCYYKCIICCRMRGNTVTPLMGQLPRQRLQPGFPFQVTGVDYAGPIMSTDRKGRGCRLVKVYIAVFVCFATKSIHLELVSDLSTVGFFSALRRFIARRGKPNEIFSDNGTAFVGAKNELRKFLKGNCNSLSEGMVNEGIQFNFSPPYAPHFGGLWEAGVKSTKFHLQRVLRNSNLTFEELYTALVQIEAILNSRPLSPLSSDPDDLLPLTPGHFLIGRPLTTVPSPDFKDVNTSRLARHERIEQLRQHLWQRWHKEYVSELQQRIKWRTSQDKLAEGTMVVVKEDAVPPMKWTLGRVVKIYPGQDGISRVADIRTSKGLLRRAFSRICPLPLHDEAPSKPAAATGVC